jgi:heat shock protein HtpX
MNNLKTALLLIVLSGLLVWLGGLAGGSQGATLAFGIALAMNFFAYWFSDRMVLRMYRAQPVTEAEAPELYNMVADLAQRASMPMPKLYVIPSETPNAFATGRSPKHAAVAVTQGITRMLDREELRGVLAHELSHVRHRDILIGTIAATVVAAVGILSRMAQFAAMFGGGQRDGNQPHPLALLAITMVAALGAVVIQLSISRSREFEADAGGARLVGDGTPLASALRKLELGAQRIPMDANPATAHMFIVSPLSGGRGGASVFSKLFRTHPPTEERVARLMDRSWAA